MRHEERNCSVDGHDRIVVSTLRCGRNNPGSNPGHGNPIIDVTLFLVKLKVAQNSYS